MKPQSAIKKGKELEHYIAQRLVDLGIDPHATRQPGSGNGLKKGDIRTTCGWTIEAKNTKIFNWKSARDQVRRESMSYQKELVVWHPPQCPLRDSIAILSLEDLLELIASYERNKSRTEVLDKYQVKSNLEKAIFHLKQVTKEL